MHPVTSPPASDSAPAIAVRGLNHYFGRGSLRKHILFDVTFEIARGEVVILMGPSGSGKTTILTLVGGLRAAQEGSLNVLGQELCNARRETLVRSRRHNGYIFQAHNLHSSLTAMENVQMGLEVHGTMTRPEMQQQAAYMLDRVGLADHGYKYPDALSGGQKQRVAIARALVSHPAIVLADEPTAALDKQSGRDVVELMQQLAREQGSTILMVTHDNRILDVADRIMKMEDGRLITNHAQAA